MKIQCDRCANYTEISEKIQKIKDGRNQIRGECSICGAFLGWIPYAKSKVVGDLIQKEWERQNDRR